MQVAALILGPTFPPSDESRHLLDRLLVDLAAFVGRGEFRLTQNAGARVGTGP